MHPQRIHTRSALLLALAWTARYTRQACRGVQRGTSKQERLKQAGPGALRSPAWPAARRATPRRGSSRPPARPATRRGTPRPARRGPARTAGAGRTAAPAREQRRACAGHTKPYQAATAAGVKRPSLASSYHLLHHSKHACMQGAPSSATPASALCQGGHGKQHERVTGMRAMHAPVCMPLPPGAEGGREHLTHACLLAFTHPPQSPTAGTARAGPAHPPPHRCWRRAPARRCPAAMDWAT